MKIRRKPKRTVLRPASGFLLIPAILALAVLMIFIPVLLRLTREEVRWSVKRIHNDQLLSVAEAGLDRGEWKLGESEAVWNFARNGQANLITPDNYRYNRMWTDIDPWYEYKILFSTGGSDTATDEVAVNCLARATKKRADTREVRAVFSRNALQALTLVTDFDPNSNDLPEVYWGPIKSYSSLNVSTTMPMAHFPRKYAAKGVGQRDTAADDYNSDHQEFWAFNKNTGTPPVLDMDYYMQKAKASVIPAVAGSNGIIRMRDNVTDAVADPPGSGFFSCDANTAAGGSGIMFTTSSAGGGDHYEFSNTDAVVFIDNPGGGLCESLLDENVYLRLHALIVAGPNNNLVVSAKQKDDVSIAISNRVPQEYVQSDAAAVFNAEADTLASIVHSSNGDNETMSGHVGGSWKVDNIGFRGFLYVTNGKLTMAGDRDIGIAGVVYTNQMLIHIAPTKKARIFYDGSTTVTNAIKIVYAPIFRRLYKDLHQSKW